jgi:RHS repeat-associated protein
LQATVVENGVRKTYSARYYNPLTGRFLSRDPKEFKPVESKNKPVDPRRLHKYLYADGDPVNFEDPSGEAGFFEWLRVVVLSVGMSMGVMEEAELPHIEVEVEYMLKEGEIVLSDAIPGPPPQ